MNATGAPQATATLYRAQARAVAHVDTRGRATAPDVDVVAVGLREIRRAIPVLAENSRELLSVGLNASAASLLSNHRANVALRERGLRMISLFDYDSARPDARQVLATLRGTSYHFCRATVQMKILDRRRVLLEGPLIAGERSLIAVNDPQVVGAALRYWQVVRPTAVRAAAMPAGELTISLSSRQLEIAGLMCADLADEAIGRLLGVSVRTVRGEIAAIMRALGVRSRFAAGVELGRSGVVARLPAQLPDADHTRSVPR